MLNDYGVTLVEKGRSKEAEAAIREALDIRRKRLGDAHPAVAETLQVLGATLRAQGLLDESQAAQEEALKIQRVAFGDHHVAVANTLNSLGMLDFSRRKPGSAEPFFAKHSPSTASVARATAHPQPPLPTTKPRC